LEKTIEIDLFFSGEKDVEYKDDCGKKENHGKPYEWNVEIVIVS
jgi:hypothetical protein